MEVSNLVIVTAVEILLVLIILCVVLLVYTRNLKGLLKNLQEKIAGLIKDLKESKAAVQAAKAELDPANAYQNQINDQIQHTREYHLTLDATQDIALDLNTEAPFERQVAAFRHAMLIAEKEALYASEDENPNWNILQSKLSQLIQFYRASPAPATDSPSEEELNNLQAELDSSKKRIDNLEKFKKLFFEMEGKWSEAKKTADEYFEQLSAMAGGVENKEGFEDLLNRYHNVYDEVGDSIQAATDPSGQKSRTNTIEVVRDDPKSQDEIRKLRSVAADQHRIIAELERKLQNAHSLEEKDDVIKDLNAQLHRQTRFVEESETCIQLLEEELNTALAQLEEAARTQSSTQVDPEQLKQNEKLKATVLRFSKESQSMLDKIANLEQENEQLVSQASRSTSNPEQLQLAKQELTQLQAQYAELEEHYLDLKMKS